MAEYEMIAFRDDKAESVASMWFGSRPSDEWVEKLAGEAELGNFLSKEYPNNVILNYDNGYIEVRKHSASTNHPPAKKKK